MFTRFPFEFTSPALSTKIEVLRRAWVERTNYRRCSGRMRAFAVVVCKIIKTNAFMFAGITYFATPSMATKVIHGARIKRTIEL